RVCGVLTDCCRKQGHVSAEIVQAAALSQSAVHCACAVVDDAALVERNRSALHKDSAALTRRVSACDRDFIQRDSSTVDDEYLHAGRRRCVLTVDCQQRCVGGTLNGNIL